MCVCFCFVFFQPNRWRLCKVQIRCQMLVHEHTHTHTHFCILIVCAHTAGLLVSSWCDCSIIDVELFTFVHIAGARPHVCVHYTHTHTSLQRLNQCALLLSHLGLYSLSCLCVVSVYTMSCCVVLCDVVQRSNYMYVCNGNVVFCGTALELLNVL